MPIKLEVIDNWRCQGSGDCCRQPKRVTMTFAERRELEAAERAGFAFRPLQWRHNAGATFTDLVAGPCPFVTDDNRCNVYEARPYNCRRFACFRTDAKAEPFSEKITGMKLLALPSAQEQSRAIQTDAQPWARAHGWTE